MRVIYSACVYTTDLLTLQMTCFMFYNSPKLEIGPKIQVGPTGSLQGQ